MKFTISDPVPLPPEEVFTLLRDEMSALVPHMPDTESIEVLSREEEGSEVRLINKWCASSEAVPQALRKVIKPELLSWRDHATWSTETMAGRWRLEALTANKLFSCTGVTSIKPHAQGSSLEIEVDLEIYPEQLPGVPKLLAKTIRGQVEKFLGQLLGDNMRQLSKSITSYAASRA
jgi:hypothetical protein